MTNMNITPVRTLAEVAHKNVAFTDRDGNPAKMALAAGRLSTGHPDFIVIHDGEVDPGTGEKRGDRVEFYGFLEQEDGETRKIRTWVFDPSLVEHFRAAKDERKKLILSIRAAVLSPYTDNDGVERLSMKLLGEIRGTNYTEVTEAVEVSKSTWAADLEKAFS